MRIVTYDLEIAKTVAEVGGWGAAKRGEAGLACAVTLVTAWPPFTNTADREPQLRVWDTPTAGALCDYLEAADQVVTFNGKGFDNPCLAGVAERELAISSHYDILAEIWSALGGRTFDKGWGLDAVAKRTLGRGKTGHGELAPVQWQEGRIAQVINYCMDDVLLTHDLFCFIKAEGHVVAPDGTKLIMPVEEIPSD